MPKKVNASDVFDVNKKSGALILGKNRLDDYATKFLNKYCKQALVEPMPLPVDDIIADAKLTVKEVSLSANLDVFGCCLLLDGYVDVYNKKEKKYTSTFFNKGTILIDSSSGALFGEGAKRNTLIHELLHWEKDKTYFEILSIKNAHASESLYPILCRQSESFFKPSEGNKSKINEVKWLEWQAHRLAPRVLMPKAMFKRQVLYYINDKSVHSCDELIEKLSEFFIVSRQSAKYRIIEVGLKDTIKNFDDFGAVYSEIFAKKEYVPLLPSEAFELIQSNIIFEEWLSGGQYVFADGYFVLANEKYVTNKDGTLHLTANAKKHLEHCVINIQERKYLAYKNASKDLNNCAFMYKIEGVDERLLVFHPEYQSPKKLDSDEAYDSFKDYLFNENRQLEEIELIKMLGDPTTTLCQCLWFLMKNRNWIYPETFNEKTLLHKNYHNKIKNDKYNNMKTNVLMPICVGLKLVLRITEKIFDKSDNKLNYYKDPDMSCIRIMEFMPGLSIQDFNSILERKGLNPLGTVSKD